MPNIRELVGLAHRLHRQVDEIGLAAPGPTMPTQDLSHLALYDLLVTSGPIRRATRKLYADGHYANAVGEAYKCLNNTVKKKSGNASDGQPLMQTVFSESKPVLRIADLDNDTGRNQQAGYMMILAGVMRGIRNPRAHEHELVDTPDVALELMVLANHLMRVVERSTKTRRRNLKPAQGQAAKPA